MCHQSAVPLCLSIKISAGVFKGMLKFDGTVGDSIWYCLCLFGVVVHDWSCAVEFTNYGGLTGALPTIGCLIIILILLRSGWKVCTCVRMTSVKSFPNQTPPIQKLWSKIQMLYVYHWMRHIGFPVKMLAASDTESDYAIRCTWVLSLHLYRRTVHVKQVSRKRPIYKGMLKT